MPQQLTTSQSRASVRAEQIPERFDLAAGQLLHFPVEVLEELRHYAAELDRSVGWCLWMAWCIASVEMNGDRLDAIDGVPEGPKIGDEVVMPLGTWRRVTREAERLDRSKSWLLVRAWVAARPRFAEAIRLPC